MCPDPLQFLTYLAGQTRRIQLGTGVIVLPWHDPVRVAEQITLLDNLSGGAGPARHRPGHRQGRVRRLPGDMNTSRERFVEYARLVAEALEDGYVEYDDEFGIQQPRRAVRPRPAALVPRPHLRRGGLARTRCRSWPSSASACW